MTHALDEVVGVWTHGAVVALCFTLFVRLYEEPHLRRVFGAEYETYAARLGALASALVTRVRTLRTASTSLPRWSGCAPPAPPSSTAARRAGSDPLPTPPSPIDEKASKRPAL